MLTATTIRSPLAADVNGVIRIGGTRVTLLSVMNAFREGATPEEIAQEYPALTLADVYATIAYYLQNQAEVDAYLTEERHYAEEVRKANQMSGIRERLLARRSDSKD